MIQNYAPVRNRLGAIGSVGAGAGRDDGTRLEVDRCSGSVVDGAWKMSSNEPSRNPMRAGEFMDPGLISGGDFPLSKEHCMLLRMRDTLYEGNWEDFVSDLTARLRGEPHVFATVPSNPEMRATIEAHLSLIEEMRTWEATTGRALSPDLSQAGES